MISYKTGWKRIRNIKAICYDSETVVALSTPNERTAIAIRSGAPLASYSNDRNVLTDI